ncbi:MAG: tetratricopeptide repeat protein [Sphingomonadales bacterium]
MTDPFRRGTLTLYSSRAILGALALVLAACSSDSEVAAHKAAEASAMLDAGNLYGARLAAQASVKARDDISANWILLGRIQLAAGLIGDAYISYTRALELDATNVEAMQLVGDIALQVGRYRDADQAADKVLALQPGTPRAKLIKGFVALNDGKFDVATKFADEILAIDPTDDGGIVLKARALAKLGQFEPAIKILQNQMIVSKGEIVAATLAEVQRATGDGPGLAETLAKIVAEKPTDDRVFDLASVLYKIGRPQDARTVVFRRLEVRKDSADFYSDATRFFIAADPGALDAARIGQITSDGTPNMRELAARVLLAGNRPADARRVLEPIATTTADSDIRALYATALAMTGAAAQAPAIIASVLSVDETNVDALQLRAQLRLAGGDEKGAMADAALVTLNSPLSVGARMVTIDAYIKRDDKRRARQLFEEAVRLMPKNLDMTMRYMKFLTSEGDYSRATDIITGYTDINPSRTRGWDVFRSVCRDDICNVRAAQGRLAAGKLFPADEFAGKKPVSGLFGPL